MREALEREEVQMKKGDFIKRGIVKMEIRHKVQVKALCREDERRSWTSIYGKRNQEKFQRQTRRIKIGEIRAETSNL